MSSYFDRINFYSRTKTRRHKEFINNPIAGSDQNKYLFLWENRSNLGCFFLLKSAFQGQKQHCKNFIKAFPSSEHQYFKIEIIFSNEMVVLGVLR